VKQAEETAKINNKNFLVFIEPPCFESRPRGPQSFNYEIIFRRSYVAGQNEDICLYLGAIFHTFSRLAALRSIETNFGLGEGFALILFHRRYLMGIIATLIIGLVIGIVARFLMPGRDPMGFVLTAILGIVGSWLGSFIGERLGMYHQGEPAGFLMSVLGAVIVLGIYHLVVRNKSPLVR
jgi:uncharacterized membrane protein YeaQ/YmgE (transglycosylase-associated protein family)